MEKVVTKMDILYEYSPNKIYLTGDREYQAVSNYMWNRYHKDISEHGDGYMAARGFACRFMTKYNAKPVIASYKGKLFLYPLFGKR